MNHGTVFPTIETESLAAREEFLSGFAEELETLAQERPITFDEYVRKTNPSLLQYEHVPRLVDVGERIIRKELRNVLVVMPPRYFKTEVFSRLLPGCLLRRRPTELIGLSSYGAHLAWAISEEARNYYQEAGGHLSKRAGAKALWRTLAGGSMWASGVGGPILGFGYHVGICDDPQDPEKATSYAFQKRFRKWWPDKWVSRGMPGAQKLVVMQRLDAGDAIDFLLRREVGDDEEEAPENWHVVLCDEIRSAESLGDYDGPLGLPPTCTLEPDPRPLGAVLSPSWMSPKEVEARQRASGPSTTSTQRQQRPSSPMGDFWREDWFDVFDELPEDAYNLGWDWDLAYTKNEANSASAGVRSARGPGKADEFPIYVVDFDFDYLEFPELVEFIREKSGPHYIEDKASGKSAEQTLRREGVSTKAVPVKGDKFARATNVQPVVSNRRVRVQRSLLRRFLSGSKQGLLNVRAEDLARDKGDLDLNDAFVQGITRHVGSGKRRFAFSPGSIARTNGA